ncbi:MAG: protein translocase subunit SecD [Planctomycetia bacterium]
MTENLGKYTALTLALILVALASMVVPVVFMQESPFRLGLDLQGGTRLVYGLPFDEALRSGQITQEELNDKPALLRSTAEIVRKRVDPQGVREVSIRPEGEDRLVIELPSAAEMATSSLSGRLLGEVGAADLALKLDSTDVAQVKAFSSLGGLLRIGAEKLSYESREGATLTGLKRGLEGTSASAHAAGAKIELLSSDELQRSIEEVGDMQFLLEAATVDYSRLGSDEATEQQRMRDWRAANPEAPVAVFNALPRDAGGPIAGLRWFPLRPDEGELETPMSQRAMIAVVAPRKEGGAEGEWSFTGADATFQRTVDEYGYPALSFDMSPSKRTAFGDFTGANVRRNLAIVLNSEIIMNAVIREKLPGQGQISGGAGGFTPRYVESVLKVLRSGSLKMRLVPLDKSRVGASLGEDYVKKGFVSALVASLVVVLFMGWVYRRLGLFAVVGLLVNLVLLLGAMAFMRATLTLPGIAGIVLTVGMAVDGNILIFERLREEMARGLKLKEAARAAFDRAGVTILDANLTTLIAGAILYFLGSGPIRGFATTLCVGIMTTLFTVIIVSRVLLARDMSAGRGRYEMRELIKGQGIDFLGKTKVALAASAVVLVGSLGLWFAQSNEQKLGIDFLGGYSVSVRTQEPRSVPDIRAALEAAPGNLGEATVQSITDSKSGAGYTEFRITAKIPENAPVGDQSAKAAETEIRSALASLLARGPLTVEVADGAAKGELYFKRTHAESDIAAALGGIGLAEVVVSPLSGPQGAYGFNGKVTTGASSQELSELAKTAFTGKSDSSGNKYTLVSAVPESFQVGPQVAGELLDKAVRAMLLALFATVLYLRFRFDQWSYGIAVVAALAHDVLVTLGALAVGTQFGFVQAELDLSMVAAFLTIIGYSQNDTIVIFDRVRENLGKSKKSLKDIINDSLNETLGRTILTSVTVFLTILVLFIANYGSRNVLEGFGYAMLVGVISGTYSTIYIAGPVLLWLENRAGRRTTEVSAAEVAKA